PASHDSPVPPGGGGSPSSLPTPSSSGPSSSSSGPDMESEVSTPSSVPAEVVGPLVEAEGSLGFPSLPSGPGPAVPAVPAVPPAVAEAKPPGKSSSSLLLAWSSLQAVQRRPAATIGRSA